MVGDTIRRSPVSVKSEGHCCRKASGQNVFSSVVKTGLNCTVRRYGRPQINAPLKKKLGSDVLLLPLKARAKPDSSADRA